MYKIKGNKINIFGKVVSACFTSKNKVEAIANAKEFSRHGYVWRVFNNDKPIAEFLNGKPNERKAQIVN